MDAYIAAMRQAIKPGCVVADIGSGPGVMAMVACQLGAGRVFAIEPDASIHIGAHLATRNGFGDRIEFMPELSTRVTLPQRADVVVSDLRGVLPPWGHHFSSIADARRRILAPDGALIPRADTIWAAVVEAPAVYDAHFGNWSAASESLDLDLNAARHMAANAWTKARIEPHQLLAEPVVWNSIDYATVESSDLAADVCWQVSRPGTAHGLALWFDASLGKDIGFSNAPGEPELVYGHAFFPLLEPVVVQPGDVARVDLRAKLVGDEYVWVWSTQITGGRDSHTTRAAFRQSTFHGRPLSPDQLHKQANSFQPQLSAEGQLIQAVLQMMDGELAISEIAARVLATFPDQFSSIDEAASRVGNLSLRYSR